jgi:uncharacterized protein (DUF486 family)
VTFVEYILQEISPQILDTKYIFDLGQLFKIVQELKQLLVCVCVCVCYWMEDLE